MLQSFETLYLAALTRLLQQSDALSKRREEVELAVHALCVPTFHREVALSLTTYRDAPNASVVRVATPLRSVAAHVLARSASGATAVTLDWIEPVVSCEPQWLEHVPPGLVEGAVRGAFEDNAPDSEGQLRGRDGLTVHLAAQWGAVLVGRELWLSEAPSSSPMRRLVEALLSTACQVATWQTSRRALTDLGRYLGEATHL